MATKKKAKKPFDWLIALTKEREGKAALEFVRLNGGAETERRLEGGRDEYPSAFVDGEDLTTWCRDHDFVHVAQGAKLVTFEPADLEVLTDFYEAACSARPPHAEHLCREEIGPRPIAFLGRHVFIGFNSATKKKMTALLAGGA